MNLRQQKPSLNSDLQKIGAFMTIVVLGIIIGGMYGILHDQLTYTISPEYYTKFKFYQFGLIDEGDEAIFPNPRLQVSAVGWMATWWVGLIIAIVLGFAGFFHKTGKQMLEVSFKAILFSVLITFVFGIVGLFYGKLNLAKTGVDWWLPENLVDKENFIAVGSMHNFGYMGGLIGLIVGVIYSINKKNSYKETLQADNETTKAKEAK